MLLAAGTLYVLYNRFVPTHRRRLLRAAWKQFTPHVKLKVLRVIKHCCLQGHATFRRDMQRETTAIKACLSYRGTPDPMHGDTLNKAVRDMAQEVMNAVFDTSTASEQLHSAGRMQGFGNPNYTSKREEQSKVSALAS